MRHIPVLLNEVTDALNLKPNINLVDCTLGDAGHAEAILEKTGSKGRLLGIDADAEGVLRAKRFLYRFDERAICVRENFVNLKKIVAENKFAPVHGILMDLGWSSPQFEERGRGFSFLRIDELLDMRYDVALGAFPCHPRENGDPAASTNDLDSHFRGNDRTTAANIVNEFDIDELARLFREYGEEKLAKEIAEAIGERRKVKVFEKVGELVELILHVYRNKLHSQNEVPWIGGIHPATKVFQALRVAVNHELEVIRQALPQAIDIMVPGGRLAVITFHSLEDRIVKHYFQSIDGKQARLVIKKPIIASEKEIAANPRARSAKLRVVEKISTT